MHLFTLIDEGGVAVINIDDPMSEALLNMRLDRVMTYGLKKRGDVWAHVESDTINGLTVSVHHNDHSWTVKSNMVGTFNAYNVCAAFATSLALNVQADSIVTGIERLKQVRGRLERVVDNVFVDYAHTPSAIENALRSLKKYTTGKLVVVFGCGGDRDKSKRPLMGSIASRLADYVVVTSDNPRSEPPDRIIQDIVAGIADANYQVISDRRSAIEKALSMKKNNDVVLVAGKGHEEYQIIGDRRIFFDDAEVIRSCFKKS
jgi:UDP-N-acetylmuramoyl-L-alanyl-D-glutamate--2,6-diaminopimelate ligase